eukprot:PhM_4_TR10435/c0_g1_i2/m.77933
MLEGSEKKGGRIKKKVIDELYCLLFKLNPRSLPIFNVYLPFFLSVVLFHVPIFLFHSSSVVVRVIDKENDGRSSLMLPPPPPRQLPFELLLMIRNADSIKTSGDTKR